MRLLFLTPDPYILITIYGRGWMGTDPSNHLKDTCLKEIGLRLRCKTIGFSTLD